MAYVSLATLVSGFFIVIVVNGRIAQQINKKELSAPFQIIKDNWKNYLIAGLVLAAPILGFNHLNKLASLSVEQHILLKEAIRTIIWIVSIYVMPIVFLKKLGFVSIIAGISYFFQNIKQSMSIIPVVALMFTINAGGYLWAMEKIQEGVEALNVMPVMVVLNIASTYLSFIVFAAATIILVESYQNRSEGEVNA